MACWTADSSSWLKRAGQATRDPASIAFAQLAEEYRRAGRYKEAIETCESGLVHHPGYLSARVTLGRAFVETGELEAAQMELKQVLRAAPENLAALRGLAEIHHRRGELHEALAHYRTALEFARHDLELEHLVHQIEQELEPRAAAPVVVDGLSFDEVKAIIGETPIIDR
jgi:Tfp pilus assembly protein PilF